MLAELRGENTGRVGAPGPGAEAPSGLRTELGPLKEFVYERDGLRVPHLWPCQSWDHNKKNRTSPASLGGRPSRCPPRDPT
jgi:hypothetical protein